MRRILVVTDLDGTLLDTDYSFAGATEALQLLERHAIALILCSSKTRAELEYFRQRLGNHHPFISENGGGVFIPTDYFPPRVYRYAPLATEDARYRIFRLGAPYAALRRTLTKLRREGFAVSGFGDLDPGQVSALTGLSPEQAALAKERDFDEPFLFEGTMEEEGRLLRRVRRDRLHLTRGRLWHLLGDSDKGRAVALLLACYRTLGDDIVTIGLGDQRNDFPLLEQVDLPVLIRQPEGGYAQGCTARGLQYSDAVGPAGWNEAILRLIPQLVNTNARGEEAGQRG